VRALTPTAGKFEKHDDHFESDTFVVTSAVGHLVEIQAPEEFDVKRGKWSFAHLPVIPPYFDLKPVEKTKSRLAAVVKQAKRKDVSAIINACDAGREGELIFRLIEQYAGGKKPLDKPVKRLWLSRTRSAESQKSLDRAARQQSVCGLYTSDKPVPEVWVGLVDDVTTTGSTLDAAAHALRQAGACGVIGLVGAKTPTRVGI
jgi:DNA topoisomerase-3